MEVADGTKYYFKPAMTLDDEVSWVRTPFRLADSAALAVPRVLVSALFRLRLWLRLRLLKADKKRCLDLQVQPKQMGAAAGGEDIPLFVHSAVDDYTFKINPAAQYIGGNDELFELFGILMAKALIDRNQVTTAHLSPRTFCRHFRRHFRKHLWRSLETVPWASLSCGGLLTGVVVSAQINLRFNSAFFKALLSLPFDMKDLESVDHEMYTSVQQILEMPPCVPQKATCCFHGA